MRTLSRKKKFKIHRLAPSEILFAQRNDLIQNHVGAALKTFLEGKRHRNCVTCGVSFEPRHRNHFNCNSVCSKVWDRGMLVRRD